MVCNLGVFMLGSAFGSTIIDDPFTSDTTIVVNQSDLPNLYNGTDSTNTVFNNFTSPTNATGAGGDGSPLQFLPDYFEMPFAILYAMIQFLSGGFVFEAVALFGFPDYATWAFQMAIAFWGIYTLAYYILGRG